MAIIDKIQSIKDHVGEAYASLEEKGATIPENKNIENLSESILSVQSGGKEKLFTGHYDTEGLKQIGWSDEEIEYYQQNGVQWNESEDAYFKLTDIELAGDESSTIRFLPKSSSNISKTQQLLAIPNIDTSNFNTMSSMFSNCYSLTSIPLLDTSKVTNMGSMFSNCYSLTSIPLLDTSKVSTMTSMFNSCYSLTTIPLLDTSKVNTMTSMFYNCYSLKTIPLLNTSSVTNMNGTFNGCYSLKTIPSLDTSKVTNMGSMFYNCSSLTAIPSLDTSKVTNISNIFNVCSSLQTLGGLLNFGQAFSTAAAANNTNYKLTLSTCPKLTEQSLINVLTNLYDIASKGCNTQQIVLGSINLSKLTSEEGQSALENATAKGWTIS